MNETAKAWSKNFESFSVYTSWDPDPRHYDFWAARFEDRWAGGVKGFRVYDLPAALRERLLDHLPAEPPPATDPEEPPERRMTFLEHLDELRTRITHAVVALLVGFLIAFAFVNQIYSFVFARLTAEVPGVRREDLQIQVEGAVVTLKGRRTREREARTALRIERPCGSFSRTFLLPAVGST